VKTRASRARQTGILNAKCDTDGVRRARILTALLWLLTATSTWAGDPPAASAADPHAPAPASVAAVSAPDAARETTPTARGPLVYPEGPGRYRVRFGAGASMDVLPLKIVQSETRQVPQVLAQVRYGLPFGFSADARLTAIVVKNQLELGIAWSKRIRKVWLSVFDRHGFSYGFVGVQGFDAKSWGWLNKPGLAVGFPFDYLRFTISYELIYTLTQHTRLGDLTTVRKLDAGYAGDSLTVTVETMLRNGGVIFYGIGLSRTAPNYELWLAFSDQRARFPHPRFFAGYAF